MARTSATVTVGNNTYLLTLANSATGETVTVARDSSLPVPSDFLIQTPTVSYVDGTLLTPTTTLAWSSNTSVPANYTSAPASSFFTTPASTTFGQIIIFGAEVAPDAAGHPMPTGWVDFYDGSTKLDSEMVDSYGYAAFRTAALAVGQHTIKAVYDGDANYTPGAVTLSETVTINASTTLYVSSSGNDNNPGTSESSPLKTLKAALTKLEDGQSQNGPGGTIYMAPGTYNPNDGDFEAWQAGEGSVGHPITIAPYPGSAAGSVSLG